MTTDVMNAERAVPRVDVGCPARGCRYALGTVYEVTNYHHVEPVLTPAGEERRVTDLPHGFVIETHWRQNDRPRQQRIPGHRRVWPVAAEQVLLVWCQEHGMYRLDHDEVRQWAEAARQSPRRRVRRVPAAQR